MAKVTIEIDDLEEGQSLTVTLENIVDEYTFQFSDDDDGGDDPDPGEEAPIYQARDYLNVVGK